jgi:thiamine pyrophosphokinase
MGLKVKIFAGPKDYDPNILYRAEEDELLVGVDAGIDLMFATGLAVDLAVGDFDSISTETAERARREAAVVVELPEEKDVTDLAYCLDYLYNHYVYDSIVVYGGLGGRVDHLVANINLMKKYDLVFIDGIRKAYVLRKGVHRIDNIHKYVSFFALEDVYGLGIRGFRYELSNHYLGTSDSLCVSNSGSGEVAFTKGRLLVIETDEPEPR